MSVSNKMHSGLVTSQAVASGIITNYQRNMYNSVIHCFSSGRRLNERQKTFVDGDYTNVQAALDKITGEDINVKYAELTKKAKQIANEAYPVMTACHVWQEKGECFVYLADGTAISLLD